MRSFSMFRDIGGESSTFELDSSSDCKLLSSSNPLPNLVLMPTLLGEKV